MAVRDDGLAGGKNVVMTVKLKDSDHIYEECDIPTAPFGDNDRYVGVWVGDRVRAFPMETVEYFDIFVKE